MHKSQTTAGLRARPARRGLAPPSPARATRPPRPDVAQSEDAQVADYRRPSSPAGPRRPIAHLTITQAGRCRRSFAPGYRLGTGGVGCEENIAETRCEGGSVEGSVARNYGMSAILPVT